MCTSKPCNGNFSSCNIRTTNWNWKCSGVVFICCNKRSFHILTNQLPFFWQGVNRCRVVSRHHHNLHKGWLHNHVWKCSGVVFICCNKRSFHILTNQLPFFWQGVNRCRVVSRHHHNLHKGRLHNHVWTFILIQMPPFFPIVSVCALFEFNNVI